ncbi:MAG TPA: hypothetical protein VGF45_06660, partial [Polyangia bacterium]
MPNAQFGHRAPDALAIFGFGGGERIERDLRGDVAVDAVALGIAPIDLTVPLHESGAFALQVCGGQAAQGHEHAPFEHLRPGAGNERALVAAGRHQQRCRRRQCLQQLARDEAGVVLCGAPVIDDVRTQPLDLANQIRVGRARFDLN